MSRTVSTLKNVAFAVGLQVLTFLVNFVSRMVFVKTLGESFLGVNGLFGHTLYMLSLAELGLVSAVVFSLYQPFACGDYARTTRILRFYNKLFNIVGLSILAIGLCFLPFLGFLLSGVNSYFTVHELRLYFLLYLLSTVVSYLFAYRRAVLVVDQKKYMDTIFRAIFTMAMSVTQIVFLFLTHNFIVFLSLQVVFTLLQNIAISHKVDRLYPELMNLLTNKTRLFSKGKSLEKEELSVDYRREMVRTIRGMLYYKLGDVVVYGSLCVVLATCVGLGSVGRYSNYMLVVTALFTLIKLMFEGVTASVGNLVASGEQKRSLSIFDKLFFANGYVSCFTSVSLLVLLNPFIELWLGVGMVLDFPITLMIVLNFYILTMRKSVTTFKEAYGIYRPDRYRAIAEIVLGIILGVVLSQPFGMFGVLLGFTASTFLTCIGIEPIVLYRYGFESRVSKFYIKLAEYVLLTVFIGALTYGLSLLIGGGIAGFLLKMGMVVVLPNIIFVLFYGRTERFSYFWKLLMKRFW